MKIEAEKSRKQAHPEAANEPHGEVKTVWQRPAVQQQQQQRPSGALGAIHEKHRQQCQGSIGL